MLHATFPLVDDDVALAEADELRHRLLHVKVLHLVPFFVEKNDKLREKRGHKKTKDKKKKKNKKNLAESCLHTIWSLSTNLFRSTATNAARALARSPLLGGLVLHVRAVAPGREGVRLPLLPLPGRAVVADVGQQVVLGREKLGNGPDERVPHLLLQVAGVVLGSVSDSTCK